MTRFDALFTTRHVLQFSDVDVDTFGSIGHVWGEGHVSECYIYISGSIPKHSFISECIIISGSSRKHSFISECKVISDHFRNRSLISAFSFRNYWVASVFYFIGGILLCT